jgi:Phage P22-like portal protein
VAYQDTGINEAGAVASGGTKSDRGNGEMLATMRTRLTMAISAYSDSREDELDDLRFRAASPDNQWQWPADVLATRGSVQGQTINARPCLTINKLPQHVLQVTNDQRQNRPSGKVIPADDKADVEVAEIFNGLVRHIEYISDADVAYDTACDNQVTFGEGYFRILTEYCDDNSFEQDLRIGRIRDSFSVYMDPTIQDPCGSDAEWCFINQELTTEEYEREFPDASPLSSLEYGVGDGQLNAWINQDTVRIAEYFYIKHEAKKLNQYHGGITAMAGSPEAKQAEMMGLQAIKTRDVDVRTVKWCKTNGFEVLEERDWAGKYIPVIRVIGNEFEIDGRMYVSGLVRNAKDAQRMYNYWVSQEAEMLALAPKAPFIGYGGQFEGYEQQWKTANINNWPYLEVNPDVTGQGGPLPLPARSQPPMASTGLLQAKAGAADDIKSSTGQYDSSLGATSNERSGRAILAREKQADTGTYHYVDNLARAIRYSTRQLVDLIPKIYDTQRIARIIGIDGETDQAMIDPTQPMPVKKIQNEAGIVIKKIYNPNVGKYDVAVTTGPSYMTKRQESLDAMSHLLQGNPQLWAVAGDLFIKNMDWPGAQEMSQRFAKTIDPKLLSNEDDPALQAANQQMQAMGQEMQQMHQMLQNVHQSMEAQTLKVKEFDSQVKAYDAETKRISAVQAGMSPEQIQDIVLGTVHGMITSGDLINEMPGRDQDTMPQDMMQGMPHMQNMPQQGMEQMPPDMGQMPPQGMPQ